MPRRLYQTESSALLVPLQEWLLYLYILVAPFFVFSVFFSRDSLALWVVALMAIFTMMEVVRTGGFLPVDRSFVYAGMLLAVFILSTFLIRLNEPPISWHGRTPLERAVAIDLRLLFVIAAYVIFVLLMLESRRGLLKNILVLQIAVGAAMALLGIAQFAEYSLFHSEHLSGFESTNESYILRGNIFRLGYQTFFRSAAIYSEPSYLGFFLLPIAVKMILVQAEGALQMPRWIRSLALVVLIVGVGVSLSIGTFVAVVLLALLYFLYSLRRQPKLAIGAIALSVLLIGLLVSTPAGGAVIGRVENIVRFRDPSLIDRLVRLYTSLIVFVQHPFLGVGPGGYAFWYPRLGGLDQSVMVTPGNIWLSMLTDVGIVGGSCFVALCVSVLSRAVRRMTEDPMVRIYFWSVVSYLILMTMNDLWFLELFWFDLAVLVVLISKRLPMMPQVEAGIA